MSGKTLGQMTPAERAAAVRRAAAQLQAELQAAAPAISRVLDEFDAEVARERQDAADLARMDDDGWGCAIT